MGNDVLSQDEIDTLLMAISQCSKCGSHDFSYKDGKYICRCCGSTYNAGENVTVDTATQCKYYDGIGSVFPLRCNNDKHCPRCSAYLNAQVKGMKFDNKKARWDLLPWDLVCKTVDILTYGAQKYAPNNWQQIEPARYKAALCRHMIAWLSGEQNDPESGITHLAHAMCNLIFLHELVEKKNDT